MRPIRDSADQHWYACPNIICRTKRSADGLSTCEADPNPAILCVAGLQTMEPSLVGVQIFLLQR